MNKGNFLIEKAATIAAFLLNELNNKLQILKNYNFLLFR